MKEMGLVLLVWQCARPGSVARRAGSGGHHSPHTPHGHPAIQYNANVYESAISRVTRYTCISYDPAGAGTGY